MGCLGCYDNPNTPSQLTGRKIVNFEVLRSEIVYQGRAFDVRIDQVRLPNGYTTQLDIIDHRPSVTLIPIDQEGLIWFVRQYRHPASKSLLELPAGVAEPDEPPEISAQRELREETGMAAGNLRRIGSFYLAPGYSSEFMYTYLATELYHSPLEGDIDEFLSIEKIHPGQAAELIANGQIQDAKSLAAFLLARPFLAGAGFLK
jgi:ADP-ribose pyrophosphatase